MSKANKTLQDITIRTELAPGDLSFAIYRQAKLYSEEYNFGIAFESYALAGMHEFCTTYDPEKDRVWVCEDDGNIIGFVLLMHREKNGSQLRYFYIDSAYRGIGLGKKLMQLFVDYHNEKGYDYSYLWTTAELDSAISLYVRFGFELTEEKQTNAFGRLVTERRYELNNNTRRPAGV
ncbi:GNAT family N-acetyltransferase [Paraflavitalea pollutisoli]|uniref:GNAT family N-acetyltransferase n=1 Tax=Paraflavitalea pollutisoli TaxID=3034143 RepID=UPI0023EBF902|nr:GNAT family N-acetyltransferase [Paraflavitalea sp. H1-2-19X]